VLILSNNHISQFPGELVEQLHSLENLNLRNNDLQRFPPAFDVNKFAMKSLKFLKLANNKITNVGEEIKHFTALVKLNIKNNDLHKFPCTETLSNLKKLDLGNTSNFLTFNDN
jgi:Leucine-rich repeat (LRR) protein